VWIAAFEPEQAGAVRGLSQKARSTAAYSTTFPVFFPGLPLPFLPQRERDGNPGLPRLSRTLVRPFLKRCLSATADRCATIVLGRETTCWT
jgi:hypothetical protein